MPSASGSSACVTGCEGTVMTLDYILGGAVTVGLFAIWSSRFCVPRHSEARRMTLNGWIQIVLFCAIIIAITRPLGAF